MGLWGSKIDIKDELNKNKRAVSKAIREVDREIHKLELEESKLLKEVRNSIEKGYNESAKIFSRDILKVRKQMEKLNLARSQLMGAELRLTSIKSQIQVNNALTDLNSVMGKVNESTELTKIQSILRNFAKESDKIDVKEDMINDSIDVAFGNEVTIEDEEELIKKIYDEIYISMKKDEEKKFISKTSVNNFSNGNINNGEIKIDNNSNISIEERIRKLGENRNV